MGRVPRQAGPAVDKLGNDVGGNLVFDLDDAVAQYQLAFLQPLHLQQIGARRVVQGFDGDIEVTMFLPQARELRSEVAFFRVFHRRRRTDRFRPRLDGALDRRCEAGKHYKILNCHNFLRLTPNRTQVRPLPIVPRQVGNYRPILKIASSAGEIPGNTWDLRRMGICCIAQGPIIDFQMGSWQTYRVWGERF